MIGRRERVMRRRALRVVVVACVAAVTYGMLAAFGGFEYAAVGSPASRQYSRGDAEAVFEAGFVGGVSIRERAPVVEGAPASQPLIRIPPLPQLNGRRFCALDWHVIAIAYLTGGDTSFTVQDAKIELDPLDNLFQLDGAPLLDVQTTAIKRFLGDLVGVETAYFKQWGKIVGPDELGVGAHTLKFQTFTNGVLTFDGPVITVFMDPAGSEACS